ncbi:MAG TPA: hypothetical protein VGF22_06250 [Acidimicrobiales bacterium]
MRDERFTTLDVPFDHETVIELGAVPSIWLMRKCHSVLSHPWPLIVALWNEPSPWPACAEPASAATPSDATPTASKPAAT